nr:phage baseplate assembly protein V [uncultured Cohaesibacter sp.]
MTERFRNNEKNSPYRRGTVKEIKKGRIRVTFGDEDETDSFWLNANQGGTGANKSWSMPNVGEQVNCLIDWDGEDGCVLGSCWNSEDSAPTDDPGVEHKVFASGMEMIIDRASGNVTIKGFNSAVLEGSDLHITANVKVTGDFQAEGGIFTHNGQTVGDDHKHLDVLTGPSKTGVPG